MLNHLHCFVVGSIANLVPITFYGEELLVSSADIDYLVDDIQHINN